MSDDVLAIVTGAAGGIGSAVVRRLVARGVAVAAVDAPGAVFPADIAEADSVQRYGCDLADHAARAAVFEEILAGDRVLSALVNCAGYFPRDPGSDVTELDWESWRRAMDVNLDASVHTSLLAASRMKSTGGAIVNVASGAGIRPRLPMDYSVSKAAIIQASQSMALSLASYGIRVNVVAPGPTATRMIAHVTDDAELSARMAQMVPLGRYADPDEIASVIDFLASDDATFVTGSVYSADGGSTLR